ncbi:MAG: DUF3553 domain-containing protein [Phycisphaerae bacterium]|nr:DUF3553 domain-containing protein [Phycisphaerae bacterium]
MDFNFGDRVVHVLKPEWGTGVVSSAQNVTENGTPCQRLTIRFDRAGLKTLSTSVAELRPADEHPSVEAAGAAANAGQEGVTWLEQLEAGDLTERMQRLPESTRDPFTSLAARLKATLSLWRFSTQGASLLDWAAMQTGMKDPLARFNRHELEQYFKRFATEREAQLKRLLLDARKHPSPEIERVKAEAPPAAKDAMRRMHL